jgi:cobalt-zinc-cadmium resistance protein CzcA
LIFSLLYFAFQSAKTALIVFLNIPFAATGGVSVLALRAMPFTEEQRPLATVVIGA